MPIYKGNTKIVKLYKGSTQIVKRYKGTDLIYSASRLPAEFQEVEYIESSGTQWIDSGINATNNIFYEIAFSQSSLGSNFQTPCGSYIGNPVARLYCGILTSSNLVIANGIETELNIGYQTNLKTTIKYLDRTNVVINGTSYNLNTSTFTFDNSQNFGIFTRMYNHNQDFIGNIYLCKIYNSTTIVRDFVPCYRKADNVAGLYDLVNGVFYTNAGTGTFIVGGNV